MTRRFAASAPVVIAIGALIAACSSAGATATPGAPTAATTAAPTVSASEDTGLGSFDLPSFNADTELEAMLPSQLGGQTVQKFSMSGDTFMGSGETGSEELQALLGQFGKSASDVSVAFAGTDTATVIAYRVKGVPATQVLTGFVTAIQQSGEMGTVTITDATYSGKAVKVLTPSDTSSSPAYVYAHGEVIFVVGGDAMTPDLLNEAFSKLP